MRFQDYKSEFDRDGFVVIRQFLSGGEFDELIGNVDRYIRDIVPTLSDADAFYHDRDRPETLKQMQHMVRDDYFSDYCKHPSWMKLAEALLGEPVESQGPEWFNKPVGVEHLTPPHQDNYYFNLAPNNALTAWLALDPVDASNGGLRYVTGSHRSGLRPHNSTEVLGFSQGISDFGEIDRQHEKLITLQPGDLTVHHCETIHRADSNRSTRNRRAFAMVFRGVSCRLNEEAHQRYLASARQQHQSMGLKP